MARVVEDRSEFNHYRAAEVLMEAAGLGRLFAVELPGDAVLVETRTEVRSPERVL